MQLAGRGYQFARACDFFDCIFLSLVIVGIIIVVPIVRLMLVCSGDMTCTVLILL